MLVRCIHWQHPVHPCKDAYSRVQVRCVWPRCCRLAHNCDRRGSNYSLPASTAAKKSTPKRRRESTRRSNSYICTWLCVPTSLRQFRMSAVTLMALRPTLLEAVGSWRHLACHRRGRYSDIYANAQTCDFSLHGNPAMLFNEMPVWTGMHHCCHFSKALEHSPYATLYDICHVTLGHSVFGAQLPCV